MHRRKARLFDLSTKIDGLRGGGVPGLSGSTTEKNTCS